MFTAKHMLKVQHKRDLQSHTFKQVDRVGPKETAYNMRLCICVYYSLAQDTARVLVKNSHCFYKTNFIFSNFTNTCVSL